MTRAWVEVDLGALCRNGASIAARAGVPMLPMVNGDGYGLGALRVAMALEALDPWGFGVSSVNEGDVLRRAGITRPIVLFTPILQTEIDAVRRAGLTPALGDPAVIESWIRTGHPWHLQIDTGHSRSGMPWHTVAANHELFSRATPDGAFTHFHSATADNGSRALQEARFEEALSAMPARPAIIHTENGPAIEQGGRSTRTLFRPGVFLYGVAALEAGALQPEPVVSIRARIVEIRSIAEGETVGCDASWRAESPRRIATVPVGYADGYRRALSNCGSALLRGKRVPVAGKVTMDMLMLDVTDVEAALGDVVTLAGIDGDETITVADLGRWGDVSPYEILTGLRARLPRQYLALSEAAA